jgi:CubicO group peptidase (beta-lactamase class C family)
MILLACALTAAPARAAQSLHERIDQLMQPYAGDVPGAAVAVIEAGRVRYLLGYGMADLEQHVPVTAATNFRLASLTKAFTAASIQWLAAHGRLHLDDALGRWLPQLPAESAAVTLRQMLTHTSGLIDYEDLIPAGTTQQLHDADVLRLVAQEHRTYFPPGTQYRYSDTGYSLLSLVVARAACEDFASFLRDHFFGPLKMSSSVAFEQGISSVAHRAYGYSAAAAGWVRTDQSLTSAVLGDGGVYSSAADLVRWDAALAHGPVLGPAARREACRTATPTDDPNVGYGFGWRITGENCWHSGETMGFRHAIVRYPTRRFTVIVLTNRNEGEPYDLALAIADLFLRDANRVRAREAVTGPDSGAHPLVP